ncbi:MAG: helix-hairpin-helix domain-containing protein [Planctomycetales bacterium]|nr:helix-hairpin-helix domain-containing protein [Planctomycetales bacterium]
MSSRPWLLPRDQRTLGWAVLAYLALSAAPVCWLAARGQLTTVESPRPAPRLWVNLNQAGPAELSLLPGIGPALAERIVARRETKAFRYVEQLRDVRGIGPKTMDKLRPLVFCGAATDEGDRRGPRR